MKNRLPLIMVKECVFKPRKPLKIRRRMQADVNGVECKSRITNIVISQIENNRSFMVEMYFSGIPEKGTGEHLELFMTVFMGFTKYSISSSKNARCVTIHKESSPGVPFLEDALQTADKICTLFCVSNANRTSLLKRICAYQYFWVKGSFGDRYETRVAEKYLANRPNGPKLD